MARAEPKSKVFLVWFLVEEGWTTARASYFADTCEPMFCGRTEFVSMGDNSVKLTLRFRMWCPACGDFDFFDGVGRMYV